MTTTTARSDYLRTLAAVRETTSQLIANSSHLKHFDVNLAKVDDVVQSIISLITRDYPTPSQIPPHSRWRHFEVAVPGSSVDPKSRIQDLLAKWESQGIDELERVRRLLDLFVVSVLLDAGAGDKWRFLSSESSTGYVDRSEGLALASLEWFLAGGFSSDPVNAPERVDAVGLQAVTVEALKNAMQVSDSNPLVGAEGRCSLLQRLGAVGKKHKNFFQQDNTIARPGHLLDFLLAHPSTISLQDISSDSNHAKYAVRVESLWEVVMDGISGVWPATRTTLGGVSLGDVWPCQAMQSIQATLHSHGGEPILMPELVAFHKLSQWLTFSLMEPLALVGIEFVGVEDMTGLAEYRNGGVFVDMGVLSLRQADVDRGMLAKGPAGVPRFEVFDDVVVEWRALTVGLLDIVGKKVREKLGKSEKQLPLVKVLEAGTWKLGREVAAKLRPHTKGPPIEIISDGTVF